MKALRRTPKAADFLSRSEIGEIEGMTQGVIYARTLGTSVLVYQISDE